MGLIAMISFTLAGVMGAVLSRQLSDEFKAWTPWIVDRIVRFAVSRAPPDLRKRLDEEWRSHLAEIPGDLGKLLVAVGFVCASFELERAPRIKFYVASARVGFYILKLVAVLEIARFRMRLGMPALIVKPDRQAMADENFLAMRRDLYEMILVLLKSPRRAKSK